MDFLKNSKYDLYTKILITDNIIKTQLDNITVVNVSPDFFGIYYYQYSYNKLKTHKKFSVLMHRVSNARHLVFYNLVSANLLDYCYCSYNMFTHTNNAPTDEFNKVYSEMFTTSIPLTTHLRASALIPYSNCNRETSWDIQHNTDITLIVESFPCDTNLTFSEKTFRSLQMPRLWFLYSAPGSVKYLATLGFDTFSEYINHAAYDMITNNHSRIKKIIAMMDELKNTTMTDDEIQDISERSKKNISLLKGLNTHNLVSSTLIKLKKVI